MLFRSVVAYCDSTIAFPLFCEYAVGCEHSRSPRKELVHKRDALLAALKDEARSARRKQPAPEDPIDTMPDLEQIVLDVIESVTTRELEAQDHEGRWYSLQMRPYKTSENRIDGVVLALIDIDAPKLAQAELERQVQERAVGRA